MSSARRRRPLGSTYRLQLAGLGFAGAIDLVGYLHDLGVETLYVSPVLAAVPGVKRKGDAVPYTSHNGHMFTYLSKAGVMALRLPEKDREAFLKKYATRLCTQYGTVQKE